MVSELKPVIELQPIESSNLDAIGYDLASQTAAVRFKNSATVHHYTELTPAKWEKWQAAESKGSFFATQVRNQHPHSIVETDDEDTQPIAHLNPDAEWPFPTGKKP